MIVFREFYELRKTYHYLDEIRNLALSLLSNDFDRDRVTELLIETGIFESAAADALNENADDKSKLIDTIRLASVASGEIYLAFVKGNSIRAKGLLNDIIMLFNSIGKFELPHIIKTKIPEGYSYYSLYPEMYIEAANRFVKDYKPVSAAVIGIRNIGTSLSAVVSAVLKEYGCIAGSFTVRPRGHPFSRELLLSQKLLEYILSRRNSYFIITDEGPGLSGSSFASVVSALVKAGIKEEQIILFPSWMPDGNQLMYKGFGDLWNRLKKYSVSFEEIKDTIPEISSGYNEDISGGKWRNIFYQNNDSEYPPVNLQFERRKYIITKDSKKYFIKFAGLGKYGRGVFNRAVKIYNEGFGPPVESFKNGFITYEFLPHEPLGRLSDKDLSDIARYFSFIKSNFQAERSLPAEKLIEMIYLNIYEGISPEYAGLFQSRNWSGFIDNDAAEIDNRMMKHEWIRYNNRLIKTDGDNHFKDHFFPGCIDIAWDLAAMEIEFNLDRKSFNNLLDLYIRLSKDNRIYISLQFYRIAYLSFKLGWVIFSADNLKKTGEEILFRKKADYYISILKNLLKLSDINQNYITANK